MRVLGWRDPQGARSLAVERMGQLAASLQPGKQGRCLVCSLARSCAQGPSRACITSSMCGGSLLRGCEAQCAGERVRCALARNACGWVVMGQRCARLA